MNIDPNPFFIENNFELRNAPLSPKETVSNIYKILNKGIPYNGGLSGKQWESLIQTAKRIEGDIKTNHKNLSFPRKIVSHFRNRTTLNLCGKIEKINLEALQQKEARKIGLAKHFGCRAENLTYNQATTYLRSISDFAETTINSLQIPSQIKYQSRLKTRSFTKRMDVEKTLTELQSRPSVEKATRAFTLLISSTKPNNDEELARINNNLHLLLGMGASPKKSWISAFKQGDKNLMEALLTSPAVDKTEFDMGLKNKYGDNPLHLAIKEGHTQLAKLLLEQERLNISEADGKGNTPLHLAVQVGNAELLELLLARGDIQHDLKNQNGLTFVHIAASSADITFIRLLIEKDVNFNLKDVQGNTPLHLAYDSERLQLLLECKTIDVNAKNLDGDLFWSNIPKGERTHQRGPIHCICYKALLESDDLNFDILDKSQKSLKSVLVSSFKSSAPSTEVLLAFINKVPIKNNEAIYQELFVSFMTKGSYNLVNLLMDRGLSPEFSFACDSKEFYDADKGDWVYNRTCPVSYQLASFWTLNAGFGRRREAEFSRGEEEVRAALINVISHSSGKWLDDQDTVGEVKDVIELLCKDRQNLPNPEAADSEEKKTEREILRAHLTQRVEFACDILIELLIKGASLEPDLPANDTYKAQLERRKDDLGDELYIKIMDAANSKTKSARKI